MLTLRPSTKEELDRVLAIESAPDTAKWLGEIGRAWHERARSDPDQEHVVAIVDDVIVGFGVAAGLRTVDRVVELRRMAVDPGCRGRGLGRSLLRSMTRRAYGSGAQRVWLDVKPDNERALALYRSEGFEPTEPTTASEDLIVLVHVPTTSDRSPRHK